MKNMNSMNETRDLGIDCGKHMTKATNGDTTFSFLTRVKESDDDLGHGYVVEFDNRRFIVSDELTDCISFDTKKKTIEHKVAMYLALHLLCDNFNKVNISLGCPTDVFFNKENRDEYLDFMFDRDTIEVTVTKGHDKPIYKKLFVEKYKAFPESIGAIYQDPKSSKGKLIGVIDIGGLNASGCIYMDRKPVPNTHFGVNEGGNIVFNNVKKFLRSGPQLNPQDYQIPFIINDGVKIDGVLSEKDTAQMDRILYKQIEKIITECKKNNWDLSTLDIVCVGGGSILMEKHLKELIPQATVVENPVFSNCIAFYNMIKAIAKKGGN